MADPAANLSFLPWVREGAAAAIAARRYACARSAASPICRRRCRSTARRAADIGPAARTGRRHRASTRGRSCAWSRCPSSGDFEPNYLAVRRVRSARFPVAVHAGARQRERAAAAVALPGRRARAGGREHRAGERRRSLPVLQHRRARRSRSTSCPTSPNAGRGRMRRSPRPTRSATSVRNGAARRDRAVAVAARLPAPPRARHGVHRLRRSHLRARAQGGARLPRSRTAKSPPRMRSPRRGRSRARRPRRRGPAAVELPVYHQWRFRTGSVGDFESLARRCVRSPRPHGLGCAAIDISHPGFALAGGFPAGATVDLEGALQADGRARRAAAPGPPASSRRSRRALAPIVNAPGLRRDRRSSCRPAARADAVRPLVRRRRRPSRRPRRRGSTSSISSRAIARSPRFGTQVIQQQQEALMASAWEQAAELREANQRLRRLQLSLVVGKCDAREAFLGARAGSDDARRRAGFRTLAHDHAVRPGREDRVARIASTALPVQATSSAMSRIGRVARSADAAPRCAGLARSTTDTWIGKIGGIGAIFMTLPAATLATVSAVRPAIAGHGQPLDLRRVTRTSSPTCGRPLFRVAGEGQPVPRAGVAGLAALRRQRRRASLSRRGERAPAPRESRPRTISAADSRAVARRTSPGDGECAAAPHRRSPR